LSHSTKNNNFVVSINNKSQLPMKTDRLVIYPKDIGRITGKSQRHARSLLHDIRKAYGKEKHQMVSLTDFCNYTGLDPQEVAGYLQ
jgi:hypothetical protein